MKRRRIAVAVAAAIIIMLVFVLALRHRSSAGIVASGTIEATQSNLTAKVQARVVSLPVQDGSAVKKGQTLAVLEQTTQRLGLDQARAVYETSAAQVANAQAAYELQYDTYQSQLAQAQAGVSIAAANMGQAGETLGIETRAAGLHVDQAQAQLRAARSAYRNAAVELTRTRRLVKSGDEPQRTLDGATAAYDAALAQEQGARDALALAQADRRNVAIRHFGLLATAQAQRQSFAARDLAAAQWQLVEQRLYQLRAAQAQLAQSRAALGLAEDQVRETRITAPFDGYVVSHNAEAGDLISPGAAVITIADLVHPYLYVYIDETDLPRVKRGMHADVTIDGMPGKTYTGTVTEIANSAEFTPENVQTQEQRIEYLVFRIKIQFTDRTGALKPGLPADATLRV